jgi:hypothetical protein
MKYNKQCADRRRKIEKLACDLSINGKHQPKLVNIKLIRLVAV